MKKKSRSIEEVEKEYRKLQHDVVMLSLRIQALKKLDTKRADKKIKKLVKVRDAIQKQAVQAYQEYKAMENADMVCEGE